MLLTYLRAMRRPLEDYTLLKLATTWAPSPEELARNPVRARLPLHRQKAYDSYMEEWRIR